MGIRMSGAPKFSILAGPPLGGPRGTLGRVASKFESTLWLAFLQSWRDTRLYGYIREIRNCYQRILLRRELALGAQGHRMGPLLHRCSSESRGDCIETHARKRDIQNLCSLRTYSTLLDVDLFSAGWELGAEWMRSNFDKRCCDVHVATLAPQIPILGCKQSTWKKG